MTGLMKSARLAIRLVLAAIALVGWGMWSEEGQLRSSSYAHEDPNTTVSDFSQGLPEAPSREFTVDRYGNRIEEAVGDYRVDPRRHLRTAFAGHGSAAAAGSVGVARAG
jgi:hypothetical protein